MAKMQITGKKELIDKANSSMVAVIAIAGFLTVFSLVASRALFSQRNFQARVIDRQQKTLDQINTNKETISKLDDSYQVFISPPENLIGGTKEIEGGNNGDNGKIILDALPSKYDYPALINSIDNLINSNGIKLTSVSGKDEEVAQAGSGDIKPIEMPFSMSADTSSFTQSKEFFEILYRSIRPINIKSISMSGEDNQGVSIDIEAVTYFQPSKGVTVTKETIK